MATQLRIGVVLLRERENHCLFFGPMGLRHEAASAYLDEHGLDLALGDRLPPWSDYSDVKVAAAYCHGAPHRCGSFVGLFAHADQIRICASVEELVDSCDAVMLINTGGEGEANRSLVETSLKAGKPIYVDKFLAPRLRDALAMVEMAEARGVLIDSASLLLTAPRTLALLEKVKERRVDRVVVHGKFGESLAFSIHLIAHLQLGAGCRRVETVRGEGPSKSLTVTVEFDGGPVGRIDPSSEPDIALDLQLGTQVFRSLCPVDDYRGGADTMMRRFFDSLTGKRRFTSPGQVMIDALVIWEGAQRSLVAGRALMRDEIIRA